MSYEFIRVEHLGPVCRIYLNRPEVRNAQSRSLLRELDDAVRAAEADDAVRVLIIGAVGDHFSAGHDLKSARVERPNPTVEERWEYEEEHFLEYCLRIHDLKKPTIAQVQGACIAGGYMVANMCDLIVCADNAFFSDPVAHSMGTASLEVLIHPWVMGMRKAKELIFTGARLPAAEALQIGMINRVVPLAELEQATLELANTIAAAPPYGLRFTKRSLNRTWDAQGFRAAVQAHFDVHQLSHVTEEFQAHLKRGLDSTIKRAKAVS
ncbi:enoyl-CoA hydratase [Bordetella parapertussis]|uniref:Enoyl-CoA hydratase/isomerase n=3 Tax=Bordetella TaxID=517 RepID=A0A0H3LK39_BORBR|nr:MULTISPECIES: enoyl-CoA hydratase [Bordetella]KAK66382.1 enoyl-CoA hydratase/isomerase family protein [Bordetella bronchiseptica 980-2]KCV30781.1 enoyl-CoA hydratase/isomerase family protein [Bordetella bronchiseptica 00-P-2730]KDD56132.1 enoyl-CoA hydratase/isomerase family protein [Bordetella bronchiseptica OSU553]AOB38205.1 enoyl-CoA hydratase [Bordetella parapertussis]AUL14370.1 enoyl-CoA hydratase [Bordetella bronchiseptica]